MERETNFHFITTFHNGVMMDSGKVDHRTNERMMKPDCVLHYTTNMRLVANLTCNYVLLNGYESLSNDIIFFSLIRPINIECLQPLFT